MPALNANHRTIRVVGKARGDHRPALENARAGQAPCWRPAEMVLLIADSKMLSRVSKVFELARPES
jgi:hypothetical protein